MLDEVIREQIRSEIQQIEDIFSEFSELLYRSQAEPPDVVQRAALGSVLHSFYTGLEGIFLTVVKRIDEDMPDGERWHMDLLDQVARPTGLRSAVVSAGTHETLKKYLAFRHFFRQAYTYVLRWKGMRELVQLLPSTWRTARSEIEAFLQEQDRLGSGGNTPDTSR